MLKKRSLWLILMLVAMISWSGAARSSEPVSLISEPDDITIGALFSGAQVSVSGTVPAESEVMVQVTGKREDLLLKTKGRALGVLWMNLGSVTLHQVPALYLVYVSEAIAAYARSNPVKWQELGIDIKSITSQIEITSDRGDEDALRKEFLKLKEGEGLYATALSPMHYGKREDGVRSFATEIFIPACVPPGLYQVKALAVNDGHIVGEATGKIQIEQVGVPALLSSLSLDHGGLYGLLAVLIAIGAGLLMDFLFGDHRGSH